MIILDRSHKIRIRITQNKRKKSFKEKKEITQNNNILLMGFNLAFFFKAIKISLKKYGG